MHGLFMLIFDGLLTENFDFFFFFLLFAFQKAFSAFSRPKFIGSAKNFKAKKRAQPEKPRLKKIKSILTRFKH